jgi:hypothetical protein
MLQSIWIAHKTAICLVAAFLYSGLMSTMPPLPDNAGFFLRWMHDWLQFIGANWNKVRQK